MARDSTSDFFTADYCSIQFLLAASVSAQGHSFDFWREVLIDRCVAWLNAEAIAAGAWDKVIGVNCVSRMVH